MYMYVISARKNLENYIVIFSSTFVEIQDHKTNGKIQS